MADTDDSKAARRAYQRAWRAANPDKVRAHRDANRAYMRNYHVANPQKSREWAIGNPAKSAYITHKAGAKRRGVAFLLTFEEWWAIWQASGQWGQRGYHKGQYVMARFGDIGPYAVGNVRICPCQENNREGSTGKRHTPETRQKLSEAAKAQFANPEARKRLSEQAKNPSAEIRQKISAAHLGKKLPPEHRAKISEGLRSHYRRQKSKVSGLT